MTSVQNAREIASNIREGENPPYTVKDFREAMPGFSSDVIGDSILVSYVEMAHSVVKEARWHSLWREGMRLYIAHFATLYLRTPGEGATVASLISAGQTHGVIIGKTVGPISTSYDATQATGDLTGWAAWKLTTYGTQYATLAKMLGKGSMYVM